MAEGSAGLHRAHCTLMTLPCFFPVQVCLYDWRWCLPESRNRSLFLLRKSFFIQRSSRREVQTASDAKNDRHMEASAVDANQTDEMVDGEKVVELYVAYSRARYAPLAQFQLPKPWHRKRTSLQSWTIPSPVLIRSCTSKDGFQIL